MSEIEYVPHEEAIETAQRLAGQWSGVLDRLAVGEPVGQEPTAIRDPRGKWHRPDKVLDLVACRGRFDGHKPVQEADIADTRPTDRCETCWKDQK